MEIIAFWKLKSIYSRLLIESFFFFSSRRRHTRFDCDWSSDVCSSDLEVVGGFCRSQVLHIHGPIWVQNLGESQLDVRSCSHPHAQSRHTAEILAKIKNEDARLRIGDRFRGQDFLLSDGLEVLRDDFRLRRMNFPRRFPA